MKKINFMIVIFCLLIIVSCKKNDSSLSLSEKLIGDNLIGGFYEKVDSTSLSSFMYNISDPFPSEKYSLNFNVNKHVYLIEKSNHVNIDTICRGTYSILNNNIIFEKLFIQTTYDLTNIDKGKVCVDSIAEVIFAGGSILGIANKNCNENTYFIVSIKK